MAKSHDRDSEPAQADTTAGRLVTELAFEPDGYRPMPVRIQLDNDNTILAVAQTTDDYGVGHDVASALHALSAAIKETHEFLASEGTERLSPRLQEQLQFLDKHGVGIRDRSL